MTRQQEQNINEGKHVALVHHICPCCGKKTGEEVILSTRLGDISEAHGKPVGFEPCDECREAMKTAVLIVIVDQDKCDKEDSGPSGWYRTGDIVGMSDAWCHRVLDEKTATGVCKTRIAVMDYRVANHIGLPTTYNPDKTPPPGAGASAEGFDAHEPRG